MNRRALIAMLALPGILGCDATEPTATTAAGTAPASVGAEAITRIDLGTLGGANAWAADINNAGTVVGRSDTPQGSTLGFRWSLKGGMVPLPPLPGHHWSRADQITPAGTIFGVSDTTGGSGQRVIWNAQGVPSRLNVPYPAGTTYGWIAVINDLRQAAGGAGSSDLSANGFFWSRQTGVLDFLQRTPGYYEVFPADLTSYGVVIGSYVDCMVGCWYRPFSWSLLTGFVSLGQPPEADPYGHFGVTAMNELGEYVGWGDAPLSGGLYSYSWGPIHGFKILPPLDPTAEELASGSAIDLFGRVVGQVLLEMQDVSRPVVWPVSGGVVDLAPTDPSSAFAVAINDKGIAVGSTLTASGYHATAWKLPAGLQASPSPQPRSLQGSTRTGTSRLAACFDRKVAAGGRIAFIECISQTR